jgi:hypothetical protein
VSSLDKLDVNPTDPFGKYISPTGLLSTVNCGKMYQDAYDHLVNDPSKDMLIPITMACDESKLQKGGKAGCWPLLFSTSLFGQGLRNLAIAWRPLGYIYDLSTIESRAERNQRTTDQNCARLNAVVETVLASLVKAQSNHSMDNVLLTLGDVTKTVNLKVFISLSLVTCRVETSCVVHHQTTLTP